MTPAKLTAVLAETVMGWRSSPDRFLLGDRQWISRTQFQPFNRIQDAFRLLHTAAESFSLAGTVEGVFTVTVRIGERIGCASGKPEAATITLAVARAVGIEADLSEEQR
jgi:hypothetical protein